MTIERARYPTPAEELARVEERNRELRARLDALGIDAKAHLRYLALIDENADLQHKLAHVSYVPPRWGKDER